MQHREQDNAELKERLSKAEGQVREREQARLAADAQARSSESARSDLERALTRLEQQVKERDAIAQQLQGATRARRRRLNKHSNKHSSRRSPNCEIPWPNATVRWPH